MTTAGLHEGRRSAQPAGRRTGYVVAIAVNAVALYVVTHLLVWGVPAFLTADFATVLPLLRFSLIATMLVNAVYLVHDGPTFRSVTQLGLLGISLMVTVRLLRTFPFDFSGYGAGWELATRGALLIALAGVTIAMAVEVVRLAGRALGARSVH